MTKYWIVINITAHATQPVTHKDKITLKSYFDEKPKDDTDLFASSDEAINDGHFAVPSEHSAVLSDTNNTLVFHMIDEAEFLAPNYIYYLWAEPYGSAAFQKPGHSKYENISVGRTWLSGAHEKYRGAASGLSSLPSGVKPDDKAIEYDLKISNSVAQYIADEMSKNQSYHKLEPIEDHQKEASRLQGLHDEGLNPPVTSPRSGVKYRRDYGELAEAQRKEAFYDFGHIVHADPHPEHSKFQQYSQRAQERYFRGGGEWDHKPRIFPVWGSKNRLGNSADVYEHDIWSNIHYGFIGHHLGFTLKILIDGAGIAQIFDNFTSADDPVDKQCTEAGYNLYTKKKKIVYSDLTTIVERHPNWSNIIRE